MKKCLHCGTENVPAATVCKNEKCLKPFVSMVPREDFVGASGQPPRPGPRKPEERVEMPEAERTTALQAAADKDPTMPEFACGVTEDRGLVLMWPREGKVIHLNKEHAFVVEWVLTGKERTKVG